MNRSTPPRPDELEVSLIGPGRGECVLVHLGDNEWCIVDSCIPRGRQDPAALEYLSEFDNGALERVKLVVATHWHDDHIRGLSSVLRHTPNARFVSSGALETENFLTFVELVGTTIQGRSGVDEFAAILQLLRETAPSGTPRRLVAPMFALENRTLLHLTGTGRSFPATITALSPSDGTLRLAFVEFAQLIPKPGEAQRRLTNRAPNRTSVALWVEVGDRRVLLGADLEHTGQKGEGWAAVVECHKGRKAASVYKVAHHGSSNADCPDVWTDMLVGDPFAMVTPFNGGKRLPQPSDVRRLKQRTNNLYCTASGAVKPPSRGPLVEKTIRRVLTDRQVVEGQPGHVRLRWSLCELGATPAVELFNGAYRA